MNTPAPRVADVRALAAPAILKLRDRELLRAILDLLPCGVALLEDAGATCTFNAKAIDILGDEAPAALSALPPLRTIDHRPITTLDWPIARALRGEHVSATRYRFSRKDGAERVVSATAAPIRCELGEIVAAIASWVDVTDEAIIEERRAVLATVRSVLSSSFDFNRHIDGVARLVVPTLADCCVIDVFESECERRIGAAHRDASRAELVDRARQILARGRRPAGSAPAIAFAEGRTLLVREIAPEHAERYAIDDEHCELLRSVGLASAIVSPLVVRGATLGTLSLFYAESGRRYAEQDVPFAEELALSISEALEASTLYHDAQCARAAAERASRAKDEFLAMLGHELRNPLAPIVTALSLMKVRGDATFTKEREVIGRQVQHIIRLVDDLLDVSRVARGKLELRTQPIEIAHVVAKAVELATPMFEQKRHALSIDVADALVVNGDEIRLAQVFGNLLTNAAKYTDAGGDVRLSARRDGDSVVVDVADNGIGIGADLLPHVFKQFVQGRRSFDRSQGGLGIGLALVHTLVAMHGGEVRAESEGVGKGSRFVVRLPLLQPSVPRA